MSRALARDCRPPLFEQGYNDHILARKGQLECWKAYLDDNAHRLLLRQCYPDLMQRRMCIVIAGTRYSAFGNFMLLKRPYKVQGQCHVKARYGDLTEEERRRYGCPSYTYRKSLSCRAGSQRRHASTPASPVRSLSSPLGQTTYKPRVTTPPSTALTTWRRHYVPWM